VSKGVKVSVREREGRASSKGQKRGKELPIKEFN
jgi:hypothetical protein